MGTSMASYGFLWLPMASCFDFTKVRSSVDPSRSSGSPHATPLRGSPLQKLEVCYWASPSGIPWNTHKIPWKYDEKCDSP